MRCCLNLVEDAKLPSPETGAPEMLMERAYRLATGNTADIKNIRDRRRTGIIGANLKRLSSPRCYWWWFCRSHPL